MHEDAIAKRLNAYQDSQRGEALLLKSRMRFNMGNGPSVPLAPLAADDAQALELEPELSIRVEDKELALEDENAFLVRFVSYLNAIFGVA